MLRLLCCTAHVEVLSRTRVLYESGQPFTQKDMRRHAALAEEVEDVFQRAWLPVWSCLIAAGHGRNLYGPRHNPDERR